jgi:hypothetical protein
MTRVQGGHAPNRWAGTVRWVAAALIALPLAGGFAVQPVLAEEEPEEIVCWDGVDEDGNDTIYCEPKSIVAAECAESPDVECPIAEDEAEIRPARTWEVPASLSESSDSDSGHVVGGGGGGGVKKPRQPNHF